MEVIPLENREFILTIGRKGQITVPKAIRTRLGVRPKDKVVLRLQEGEAMVRPVKATVDSIYQIAGIAKKPMKDEEAAKLAWEEHAKNVAREGI